MPKSASHTAEDLGLNRLITLALLCGYDWYDPTYGSVLMYVGVVWVVLVCHLRAVTISRSDVVVLSALVALPLFGPVGWGAYLGLFVGLYLSAIDSPFLESVLRKASSLLLVHLYVFYGLYLLSFLGFYVNVTDYLGLLAQRTHFEFNYRPSGLLLEPNSYCVMVYLLSFICHRFSLPLGFWAKIFSVVSVLLSQSLWGIFIVPFLIYLYFDVRGSLKLFVAAVPAVFFLVGVVADTVSRVSLGLSGDELSFLIRLGDLASAMGRVSFLGEGFNYIDWISPSIFLPWLLIKSGVAWSLIFVMLVVKRVGLSGGIILLVPLFFTQPLLSNILFWLTLCRPSRQAALGALR